MERGQDGGQVTVEVRNKHEKTQNHCHTKKKKKCSGRREQFIGSNGHWLVETKGELCSSQRVTLVSHNMKATVVLDRKEFLSA